MFWARCELGAYEWRPTPELDRQITAWLERLRVGTLFGIPVIVDPMLPDGAWELRVVKD